MKKSSVLIATIVALFGVPAGLADGPFFMGLGDLPGGLTESYAYAVSSDGTTVVGVGSSATAWAEAFRWSAESGMVGLGVFPDSISTVALGVSPEASVIVGQWGPSTPGVTFAPCRWTADEGLIELAPLDADQPEGRAYDATNAGIAVGFSGEYWPVKWGPDAQPIELEVPPYYEHGLARAITPDGSLIVGATGRRQAWYASVWSDEHDVQTICAGVACDVTPDGSVVVGSFGRAWRWTEEEGRVYLGWLSDPGEDNTARAVSADGSVIIGWSGDPPDEIAFIWEPDAGMRPLADVLESEYGLDLGGWNLYRAYDVSADGKTIVGVGMHSGHREAWLAYIPEPSGLCLLALAYIAFVRRHRHLISAGPALS